MTYRLDAELLERRARLLDAPPTRRRCAALRDRTKTVDLKQVNRVLLQPHWRERPAPA